MLVVLLPPEILLDDIDSLECISDNSTGSRFFFFRLCESCMGVFLLVFGVRLETSSFPPLFMVVNFSNFRLQYFQMLLVDAVVAGLI